MVLQVSRHSVFKGKLRHILLFSTNLIYCLYSDLPWTVLFFFSSFDFRRAIMISGKKTYCSRCWNGVRELRGVISGQWSLRSLRWRWNNCVVFKSNQFWNIEMLCFRSGNMKTIKTVPSNFLYWGDRWLPLTHPPPSHTRYLFELLIIAVYPALRVDCLGYLAIPFLSLHIVFSWLAFTTVT